MHHVAPDDCVNANTPTCSEDEFCLDSVDAEPDCCPVSLNVSAPALLTPDSIVEVLCLSYGSSDTTQYNAV